MIAVLLKKSLEVKVSMVSVVELTEKFGPAVEVAPWGSCLVVQGTLFDPDWEVELADLGYRCHFGSLDNHAVTFVQLKCGRPTTFDPAPAAAARVNWRPEEDAFLIELWNQGATISEITQKVGAKFPSRVGNAVKMRLDRLKVAGTISNRYKNDSSNEVKEVEKKTVEVKKKSCQSGPDWGENEVTLLLERWEAMKELPKEHRAAMIARLPEFVGRSANGIYQKAYKLQKASKEAKKSPETSKVDDCSKSAPGTVNKCPATKVELVDADSNERILDESKSVDAWQKAVKADSKPAAAEPEWNGEFGEKCNLEHDCIVCDIVECPGRKSEGLQKSKVDGADVLVDLVKNYQILSEGYQSLSKAFVELKEDFEAYARLQSDITETHREELNALVAKCAKLQNEVAEHKHVVSGEAMMPLEALP